MVEKKIKYPNRAPNIAYAKYDCHDTMKSIFIPREKIYSVNSMCKYCKKLELALRYMTYMEKILFKCFVDWGFFTEWIRSE